MTCLILLRAESLHSDRFIKQAIVSFFINTAGKYMIPNHGEKMEEWLVVDVFGIIHRIKKDP